MLRLKRTKAGAVHFATVVSPVGTVLGWSKDSGEAVAVTEGVAKRVRDCYAGKKLVGEFAFEKVDATDMQLASAAVVEDEVGAQEFGKLQKRCKSLEAANADLEKVVDEARESARKNERAASDARKDLAEANECLEHKRDEVVKLNVRIAELEALLATATEPSKSAPVAPEPPMPVEPKHEPEPKGRKAK